MLDAARRRRPRASPAGDRWTRSHAGGHAGDCICDPAARRRRRSRAAAAIAPFTRRSPAWSTWAASVAFDLDAARRLPAAEHLIAFNGSALLQLRAARRARMQSASLMSANSHLRRVVRHARARPPPVPTGAPVGDASAAAQPRRVRARRPHLRFLRARLGVVRRGGGARGAARALPADARPSLRARRAARAVAPPSFDVVYVGSLSVAKGVPLLIDAVRRLAHRRICGWCWPAAGARGGCDASCSEPAPGRAHRRRARATRWRICSARRLCVHPSYEDGFGYAPVEALACGVPVDRQRATPACGS